MHSCTGAIDWLSRPDSGVSCHYVIDVDGTITQMVAETWRAWHAGQGRWAGDSDINSASIGIEIHNPGHELGYPAFPEAQMAAVEALSKEIVARWTIPSHRVLAHSDIAPQRKADPGEKFDWARLARGGVGYWIDPVAVDASDAGIGPDDHGEHGDDELKAVNDARALLFRLGYDVERTGGFNLALYKTVLAFQRHYRPDRCDGCIDRSTVATARQLLAGLERGAVASFIC